MRWLLVFVTCLGLAAPSVATAQADLRDVRQLLAMIAFLDGEVRFRIDAPVEPTDPPEGYCDYEPASNTCQSCRAGETCVGTSQRSIGDCFAWCAGATASNDSCQIATSGGGFTCYAVVSDRDGTDIIGASVPDADACIDHCASNGVRD